MNKQKYTSAIKKTPFEYLPSKKIGALVFEGMLYEEAFQKCFIENELEVVSEERRKEIFNLVYDRLSSLDSYLLDEFLHGSIMSPTRQEKSGRRQWLYDDEAIRNLKKILLLKYMGVSMDDAKAAIEDDENYRRTDKKQRVKGGTSR